MVEKHKAKLQELEKQRTAKLRAHAAEVSKQSVTIEANATDEGHLYGSVGAPEIVAALKKNGVTLATPSRSSSTARYQGAGPLHGASSASRSEVDGELKVWVVPASATNSPRG